LPPSDCGPAVLPVLVLCVSVSTVELRLFICEYIYSVTKINTTSRRPNDIGRKWVNCSQKMVIKARENKDQSSYREKCAGQATELHQKMHKTCRRAIPQ